MTEKPRTKRELYAAAIIVVSVPFLYQKISLQSKVYQKQSSTYHPHLINPIAVQPLLRILSDDTQAMRAKMLALRKSMVKGFSTYRLSFKQVSHA